MSKFILQDYSKLVEFTGNYTVSSIENPDFKRDLSKLHKKYLSILAFQAELLQINQITSDKTTVSYLNEWASDIGSAVFCWLHGAYKPARLLLRSSMENFIKFLIFPSDPTIISKKSVYEILDIFNQSIQPINPYIVQSKSNISNTYSILCLDTHTATESNMEFIDCLGKFPKYNNDDSNNFVRIFFTLIESYLIILLFNFKGDFSNFHHQSTDIIISSIRKDAIRIFHGI